MVFPSVNAVKRKNNIGIVDLIRQKSQKDVKVKVLSPLDDEVVKILMYLPDDFNNQDSVYCQRNCETERF